MVSFFRRFNGRRQFGFQFCLRLIPLQVKSELHLPHFAVMFLENVGSFQQPGEHLLVENWFCFFLGHVSFVQHRKPSRRRAIWSEPNVPILVQVPNHSSTTTIRNGSMNPRETQARWVLLSRPESNADSSLPPEPHACELFLQHWPPTLQRAAPVTVTIAW